MIFILHRYLLLYSFVEQFVLFFFTLLYKNTARNFPVLSGHFSDGVLYFVCLFYFFRFHAELVLNFRSNVVFLSVFLEIAVVFKAVSGINLGVMDVNICRFIITLHKRGHGTCTMGRNTAEAVQISLNTVPSSRPHLPWLRRSAWRIFSSSQSLVITTPRGATRCAASLSSHESSAGDIDFLTDCSP